MLAATKWRSQESGSTIHNAPGGVIVVDTDPFIGTEVARRIPGGAAVVEVAYWVKPSPRLDRGPGKVWGRWRPHVGKSFCAFC